MGSGEGGGGGGGGGEESTTLKYVAAAPGDRRAAPGLGTRTVIFRGL